MCVYSLWFIKCSLLRGMYTNKHKLFIQSFSLRKGSFKHNWWTDVQHMLQVIIGNIREIVRLVYKPYPRLFEEYLLQTERGALRRRIVDISNSNCWYQQFQLLISTIRHTVIVDIDNSNCWYQQFELLISTIRITDINNCHLQQFELLISVIRIVDTNNSNCWYQQ